MRTGTWCVSLPSSTPGSGSLRGVVTPSDRSGDRRTDAVLPGDHITPVPPHPTPHRTRPRTRRRRVGLKSRTRTQGPRFLTSCPTGPPGVVARGPTPGVRSPVTRVVLRGKVSRHVQGSLSSNPPGPLPQHIPSGPPVSTNRLSGPSQSRWNDCREGGSGPVRGRTPLSYAVPSGFHGSSPLRVRSERCTVLVLLGVVVFLFSGRRTGARQTHVTEGPPPPLPPRVQMCPRKIMLQISRPTSSLRYESDPCRRLYRSLCPENMFF